jgi:hypothetical protein
MSVMSVVTWDARASCTSRSGNLSERAPGCASLLTETVVLRDAAGRALAIELSSAVARVAAGHSP